MATKKTPELVTVEITRSAYEAAVMAAKRSGESLTQWMSGTLFEHAFDDVEPERPPGWVSVGDALARNRRDV